MKTRFMLHLTPPQDCNYLPQQQSRLEIIVPSETVTSAHYGELLRQGFRRSGVLVYRPNCPQCQSCLSWRVNTQAFTLNKRFRRILKQNQSLSCRQLPLKWQAEHEALFIRYQQQRHAEKQDAQTLAFEYKSFILDSRMNSSLLEFRDETGELQIVSLIDLSDDGISAVYTFYETNNKNSLGHYSILYQIALCQSLAKPWLYLGYWVADCPKLNYKKDYQPAEIYQEGAWVPYEPS